MRIVILLLAALASAPVLLPAQAAGKAGEATILLRVAKAYVGDGTCVEGGARLMVKGGKILSLTPDRGPLPGGCRVIDRRGCVLIPGLVAAATGLVESRADRPLRPDFRAVNGLDLATYRKELLRGGITAFHVAPGRSSFLPGQGSVVKPGPRKGLARIVADGADLVFVLGDAGKFTGAVYDPELFPDEEKKLLPARRELPGSVAGQGLLFRKLMRLAKDPGTPAFIPQGREGWSTAALKEAARGRLPLRFVCDSSPAVRLAANLAWEQGLPAVIEDRRPGTGRPWEIRGPKPKALILRIPLRFTAKNEGNPGSMKPGDRPDLTCAARLHREGFPIVLAPADDAELSRLLLVAGTAVRNGLPPAAALRAVTLEPARALGLGDRIGSLQPGRDADLTLLSGEPFDARTAVCEVFVDGRSTWTRPASKEVLVVRAGRVHRGDGKVFAPGVVIMEKGRITAAGRGLGIPPGARVIDRPQGVVTPGLVDGDSRLGLPGTVTTRRTYRRVGNRIVPVLQKQVSIPRYGPEVDLSRLIDPQEAGFAPAMRLGVTSAVITSAGASGRAALFNTAAGQDMEPLVDRGAALHCGLQNTKQFEGLLRKVLAYKKSFDDHEKAYREWRTKRFGPAERPARPFLKPEKKTAKKPQPEAGRKETKKGEEKKPAAGPAPGSTAGITGSYKGTINLNGKEIKSTFRLLLRRERLVGIMTGIRISAKGPPFLPFSGTYKEGRLAMQVKNRSGQVLVTLAATVSGEVIKGSLTIKVGKGAQGTFEYRKVTSPSVPLREEPAPPGAAFLLADLDDDVETEGIQVDPLLESAFDPLPLLPAPDPTILLVADPITGTWEGELKLPRIRGGKFIAEMKLSGTRVTGTFTSLRPDGRQGRPAPLEGTYSAGKFTFNIRGAIRGEATVSKDHMEGTITMGPLQGTFTADRAGGGTEEKKERKKKEEKKGKHSSPPGGPPPAPKVDEKLEPWLGVLAGETALVLHASSDEALTRAVPLLREKHKVERLIVTDSPAARKCMELMAKHQVAVLVDPGGDEPGPAAWCRAGVPVIFASGTGLGTSYMSFQAAYAVSRTMAPEAALKALTWWPGRYLGGNRVGGLERGRQADLVVWSGDPFDLASRVETVIIQGKVVHENED